MRQRSQEWFSARAGRVTASRIADVLDFRKDGKEGAKRSAYRAQIVAETLTGMPTMGGYYSPEMEHGNTEEEASREAYELYRGCMVDEVGLIIHPFIDRAGASPDGFIGADGCLELKNPKTETHLKWLKAGEVPPEHEPQMSWQMACTGRKWNDFASFDQRLPKRLRLFLKRLERDEERIHELEVAVKTFLDEVDADIAVLNQLCPGEPDKALLKTQLSAYLADMSMDDFADLMIARSGDVS